MHPHHILMQIYCLSVRTAGQSGLGKTTFIAHAMHPHSPIDTNLLLPLLANLHNLSPTGESGLGKTTFINNLVSSYVTTGKTHDGSSTSLADFQVRPAALLFITYCCVTFQALFNAVITA
jgi:septin family protein